MEDGKIKRCTVSESDGTAFNNYTDMCVGTGRLGLALHKEYFDRLKQVQKAIGFKYIRGHGLFNEDLAIYQQYTDAEGNAVPEYNFTYLDMITDNFLSLGIRPFIELGFMPHAMASGDQSVFYWRGNVTPPRDYGQWAALVQATLRHLIERCGAEEVLTWPIEVWNEPNLGGFWKDSDKDEYFKLFKVSFNAVKELDPRFRVGGPAICGVEDESWLRDFLDFCKKEKLAPDFITRHLYDIELPEQDGRYGYPRLVPLEHSLDETRVSRQIIDSYDEFRGLEMHITEFNTSYSPRTPIHDTNINAAYIAYLLSRLGDDCASYSYWTFCDVFEEQGVPFTPFHGGFGLVANGGITKPTFWSFKFFKDLGAGKCVHRSENAVVIKRVDGSYGGVAWKVSPAGDDDTLELLFKLDLDGEYCLITKTVDEKCCNPLKLWCDMGQPPYPSNTQLELLRESASPYIESKRLCAQDNVGITLSRNAVVYFELSPAQTLPDRGFSYERAVNAHFAELITRDCG